MLKLEKDEGEEALDEAEAVCSELRVLGLWFEYSYLQGLGSSVCSLLESAGCASLLRFKMTSCRLTTADIVAIADAFERGACSGLLELDLSGNWRLGEEEGAEAVARMLKRLRELEILRLRHCGLGAKVHTICDTLAGGACPVLEEINLGSNEMGDEGAAALGSMLSGGAVPRLSKLIVGANRLSATSLTSIMTGLVEGGQRIRHLGVSRFKKGTVEGRVTALLDGLRAGVGHHLRVLDVSRWNLSVDGTHQLCDGLADGVCPVLEELELGWNKIGDEGAEALGLLVSAGACPCLKKLGLS